MNTPREFSPELSELVGWFRGVWPTLPRRPFTLRAGHHVSDPDRFFASLAQDIRAGPNGARARVPALQHDLADLRRHVESIHECEHAIDHPQADDRTRHPPTAQARRSGRRAVRQ